MVDFKGLSVSLALIVIFSIALISFGSQLAWQNNLNTSITNDERIAAFSTTLNSSIQNLTNRGEGSWGSLDKDSDLKVANEITLFTIARTAFRLPRFAWNMMNIMFDLIANILHVPPAVIYGFTGILLVVIIVAGISLIKSGR